MWRQEARRSFRLTMRCLGMAGALGIASLGCESKTPEPAPGKALGAAKAAASAAKPKLGGHPGGPAAAAARTLAWSDPPGWKRVPPKNSMRMASYEIPAAPGDSEGAELNVFRLGGDVESNIDRWLKQFSEFDEKSVERTKRSVGDVKVTLVELPKGKFSGGMGDTGPKDNYGMLGAIAVVDEAGPKYFFKAVGPSKTIALAKGGFNSLADSFKIDAATAAASGAKGKPSAKPASGH